MNAWKTLSMIFWLALAAALPALATDSQLEPSDEDAVKGCLPLDELVLGGAALGSPDKPEIAWSQTLITSAANARLRSAPGTQSLVVTNFPLGTELQLTNATRQGEWIRVRTSRGEEGWISKTITLPVSDSTYPKVVRELIAARLSREDEGFVGRMELVAFIEHARGRPWSVEDLGWLELQRLRALQAALRTIPFRRERWDDRLRSWVAARAAEILYNEPGGQWIINRDENKWERTDTDGFTDWMKKKDTIANKRLREVIRIMKFLRDHKNSWTGTKSILLTTLLGERVEEWRKVLDRGYYADLPTALLHIVSDLDD